MDNFQFGYKQKHPPKKKKKKKKKKKTHWNFFWHIVCVQLIVGGRVAGSREKTGRQHGPRNRRLASLQETRKAAGRRRKERKEGASFSLSLSLSLLLSREIYLFCSLCFVLLTKSECVVASFFRRILGSPHLLVISLLRVSILNSSPVLCCGWCVLGSLFPRVPQ
jgi:hypothetical protein